MSLAAKLVIAFGALVLILPLFALYKILTARYQAPAPAVRTPSEVAAFLRDALQDADGDWDWDDFTQRPIADPALDAIRREAAAIAPPLTGQGRAALELLLRRAEALSP